EESQPSIRPLGHAAASAATAVARESSEEDMYEDYFNPPTLIRRFVRPVDNLERLLPGAARSVDPAWVRRRFLNAYVPADT
ncbi:hypothetical protein ACC848_43795, partial [Rhizobium johnstonii]